MVHDRGGLRRLRAEVTLHEAELDKLLSELQSHANKDPANDTMLLRAFGSMVHDFYTGVESIFQLIATAIDGGQPTESDWHRRLLAIMSAELPDVRPPVISAELREMLDPYRSFRHIFRNVYGHRLQWSRMRQLVEAMPDVAERFRNEVDQFFESMSTLLD